MRKRTFRSGLRFMATGVMLVTIATFFPAEAARVLFLGMADELRLTFLGFLLGGICGAWGVVVAAVGLLQTGTAEEGQIRLAPTVILLFSLVALFFILAYNSITTVKPQQLQRGESISI